MHVRRQHPLVRALRVLLAGATGLLAGLSPALPAASAAPARARPAGVDLVVAQDGSGDFTTVQAALDALPVTATRTRVVLVRNGVYREKLFVTKGRVAIVGEDREKTRIEYAELRREWRATHPDDWGAAVVNVGDDVTDLLLANLTIRNDYGAATGDRDHQFAIRGGGNLTRIAIVHADVLSDGGDTLSLWNAFTGMSYHASCTFEGWVDFVCPRGSSYVTNSRFVAHNLTAAIWHDGSKDRDHRFVVRSSRFDGDSGFPLGRNNRDGQFYLLDCSFSGAMADQPIYQPSAPESYAWEPRAFFHGCRGDGGDRAWWADNLEKRRLLTVARRGHARVDLLRPVGPGGDDARGPPVRRDSEAARRGDARSRPSERGSGGSPARGATAHELFFGKDGDSAAGRASRRRDDELGHRTARARHALRVARRRDRPRGARPRRDVELHDGRSPLPDRPRGRLDRHRAAGLGDRLRARSSGPGRRSRTTRRGAGARRASSRRGSGTEILAGAARRRPDPVRAQRRARARDPSARRTPSRPIARTSPGWSTRRARPGRGPSS